MRKVKSYMLLIVSLFLIVMTLYNLTSGNQYAPHLQRIWKIEDQEYKQKLIRKERKRQEHDKLFRTIKKRKEAKTKTKIVSRILMQKRVSILEQQLHLLTLRVDKLEQRSNKVSIK